MEVYVQTPVNAALEILRVSKVEALKDLLAFTVERTRDSEPLGCKLQCVTSVLTLSFSH